MPRLMASLRDGNVFCTVSSKCCRKALGTSSHIFEKVGFVLLFFNFNRYPTGSVNSLYQTKNISIYPTCRIVLNIPLCVQEPKRMPSKFKRIHMPNPLYGEIEKFISKPNSRYKTVAELSREAGKILAEHYDLR